MKITAGLASPGFDEFQWLRPVRPREAITPRTEILETRASQTKPDRGIVKLEISGSNEKGEIVWRVVGSFFIGKKIAG